MWNKAGVGRDPEALSAILCVERELVMSHQGQLRLRRIGSGHNSTIVVVDGHTRFVLAIPPVRQGIPDTNHVWPLVRWAQEWMTKDDREGKTVLLP
jgi:hypothetical protein